LKIYDFIYLLVPFIQLIAFKHFFIFMKSNTSWLTSC
jgi:hypothetical protein